MTTTRATLIAFLIAFPATVRAQGIDAGEALGQTPASGSLPFWSKPGAEAGKELDQVARLNERGVFQVGSPKVATGTAWVISKKHRLLVTDAHVADAGHAAEGKMIAVPSGTAQVYSVAKIWYHPGVRRYFKGGAISVRSMDPKDGEIDPHCPDLAVLQLAGDGPDLSVEFSLATPDEWGSLFSQPVAIMGFPGHDTQPWPAFGEKVAATYHAGVVVRRLTDFRDRPGAPPAELQLVQYNMANWEGFSGAPVFLASGRVGAVHSAARTVKGPGGEIASMARGIRSDCVLELLVYHGLQQKVPFPVDKSKVALDRWTKPDPQADEARAVYAKATVLVNESRRLLFVNLDYQGALEKCDAALELVPDYAEAYYNRASAIHAVWLHSDGMPREQAIKSLQRALVEATKYALLRPTDPQGPFLVCRMSNGIAWESGNQSLYETNLAILNKLFSSENLSDHQRAEGYALRGNIFDNTGDKEAAVRDWNESVRLWPEGAELYDGRGNFWQNMGRYDLAQADFAKAREIRAKRVEIGMKITELKEGGAAKKAKLRLGDMIISVGGNRVRNADELIAALSKAKGPLEMVIINVDDGRRQTISITPEAGRIGVAVVPADYMK